MNYDLGNFIIQTIVAIGTLGAIFVAIWGESIRSKLFSPDLTLELRSPRGNLTTQQDGKKVFFWHLRIRNNKPSNPAIRARVLVTTILKKDASGQYSNNNLMVVPIQLTWVYPQTTSYERDVFDEEYCDLGLVVENTERFRLSTYVIPNNFEGWLSKNIQNMKIKIVVTAEKYKSVVKDLEISWDGIWVEDVTKMEKHLVIKELN